MSSLTKGGLAGVTYVKQIQLPSLAMQIYNTAIVVEDSTFDGLTSHATAAIAFSNSTVTFKNCTFTGNENSAGAAHNISSQSISSTLEAAWTKVTCPYLGRQRSSSSSSSSLPWLSTMSPTRASG